MKSWQAFLLGALLVLLIGGGSLIFFVPVGGAMLVATPPIFDALTVRAVCPEAVEHSFYEYGSAPIDSTNPSGGTAHYRELTCTYADGSQKTFDNEEVALKGLGATFALAGICGGAAVLVLALVIGVVAARVVSAKR